MIGKLTLNEFVFPFWICPTDLKPDCVIFSMQRKICIILEMAVPMHVSIEKWHSVKLEKYLRLGSFVRSFHKLDGLAFREKGYEALF